MHVPRSFIVVVVVVFQHQNKQAEVPVQMMPLRKSVDIEVVESLENRKIKGVKGEAQIRKGLTMSQQTEQRK